MAEWVYKATTTKATYEVTVDLAGIDNFLCRSAYEPAASKTRMREVGRVAEVAAGDTVHFYFRRTDNVVRSLGSYRVCGADAFPGIFVPCHGHGALVSVAEPNPKARMMERLSAGYERDPRLRVFTGWVIERLASTRPPLFDQARLVPGPMTNLWFYPDPSLPKTRKR